MTVELDVLVALLVDVLVVIVDEDVDVELLVLVELLVGIVQSAAVAV